MKTYRAFLILLVVSGCGGIDSKQSALDERSDFYSELSFFVAAGKSRGVDYERQASAIIVKFGAVEAPAVAKCVKPWIGDRSVLVDPDHWRLASAGRRKSVLLHELGHCILGRDHVMDPIETSVPSSIMSPSVPGGEAFNAFEGDYLDELFHNS